MRGDEPVELLEQDLGAKAFAGTGELDHYIYYLITDFHQPKYDKPLWLMAGCVCQEIVLQRLSMANNYCSRRRRSSSWKRGSERRLSYLGSTLEFVSAGDRS